MVDTKEKITLDEAKRLYRENGNQILGDGNSFVSLKNINKIYPNNVQAVFNFNLDVEKNDFVALVGPSGCGKSTTLRMIAGLEEISSGHLFIDNVLANYLESKDRDIAMVFQSYALYPQLNVYDNIAFGLNIRKMDKKEIQERVFKAADILDLGAYLDRKPKELSGGQMQRVALGRAIVRNAKLFLMDEPLSNLDAKLRVQMRSEIVRIHEEVGATTIYVTHDQTEAMTMANKIVVMNKGFIQQVGSPICVYNCPKNLFVATFIGTPPMNILDATYDDGKIELLDGVTFEVNEEIKKCHDEFYKTNINKLKELLLEIDSFTKVDIDNYYLELKSRNYEVEKSVISLEQPKKENIISKVKKLFTKTKESQFNLNNYKEEFKNEIERVIREYTDALVGPHKIKIGIRPEDIKLAKDEEVITFELESNLVEILGSEFIVYGTCNDSKLIVKSIDKVRSHSKIKCALDINKIHIFDSYNGENISFNYIFNQIQKEEE